MTYTHRKFQTKNRLKNKTIYLVYFKNFFKEPTTLFIKLK